MTIFRANIEKYGTVYLKFGSNRLLIFLKYLNKYHLIALRWRTVHKLKQISPTDLLIHCYNEDKVDLILKPYDMIRLKNYFSKCIFNHNIRFEVSYGFGIFNLFFKQIIKSNNHLIAPNSKIKSTKYTISKSINIEIHQSFSLFQNWIDKYQCRKWIKLFTSPMKHGLNISESDDEFTNSIDYQILLDKLKNMEDKLNQIMLNTMQPRMTLAPPPPPPLSTTEIFLQTIDSSSPKEIESVDNPSLHNKLITELQQHFNNKISNT